MDDFQQNLVFVEKVAGKISGLFLAWWVYLGFLIYSASFCSPCKGKHRSYQKGP
jgi:hypothetical protein